MQLYMSYLIYDVFFIPIFNTFYSEKANKQNSWKFKGSIPKKNYTLKRHIYTHLVFKDERNQLLELVRLVTPLHTCSKPLYIHVVKWGYYRVYKCCCFFLLIFAPTNALIVVKRIPTIYILAKENICIYISQFFI